MMAGGNHPKPPPPSSSSANRKSRWETNSTTAPNTTAKSPAEPKPNPNDHKPSPKTKPNPKPNPSPKQHHPHHPSSNHPHSLNLTHFPDPPPLPPLPPPAYGFHMLERRTIILADGSVRSYFALPPDYQHLPPPRPLDLPPFDLRRHPDFPNHPQHEASAAAKRKYGGRDEEELARQRDQLLRNANQNGFYSRGDFSGGGPSDSRPSKQMRGGGGDSGGAGGAGVGVNKHQQVDQEKLKKAFLHFTRLINENPLQKKSYLEDGKQGRLQCIACGRSAKDFPDMHALIMHTYNSDNAELRVDHLGLHKALCVLMGWNYSKPPDNSKAYQLLSADVVAANRDDLIMWPPLVIIHNTNTGKTRDGRMEGLGNKTMDNKIRELGIMGGKSKSLYGREGHLGITLVKFAGDQSGLKEAMQLAEHFEKENHGRNDWVRVQPLTLGKDDENNPNLVQVDDKNGEKRRILYGYLGTAYDLDKVDFDTRKKAVIESRREYKPSM